MELHEHKLVKRISAVSFQETATVYDEEKSDVLKANNLIAAAETPTENKPPLKFRTILKKTMPKIQCISQFASLHENIHQHHLERNAEIENNHERAASRTESINSKPMRNKKPLVRSKSAASIMNLENLGSSKNEVIQSFLNSSQPRDLKKTNKTKPRKSVRRKKEEGSNGNTVFIYSKDYQKRDLCNTEGAQECLRLHRCLEANGVTVSLNTLRRALLPPSETRIELYELNQMSLPNNTYNGLLNHPSTWMPKEYARLKSAKKIMEQFEEETIRQSTVITSDDETSLSSSDDRGRQTPSKSLQYNEFARKLSKSSVSHIDLKGKRSVLLTKAKAVCKFRKGLRPKTAI